MEMETKYDSSTTRFPAVIETNQMVIPAAPSCCSIGYFNKPCSAIPSPQLSIRQQGRNGAKHTQ
jgi:hypothetical protein